MWEAVWLHAGYLRALVRRRTMIVQSLISPLPADIVVDQTMHVRSQIVGKILEVEGFSNLKGSPSMIPLQDKIISPKREV